MKPDSGLDIECPSEFIKPEPGTGSGDPTRPESNSSSWMDHCYVPRVRPSEANGFAVYTRNKRLKSRSMDRTACAGAAKIEGDPAVSVKVEDGVRLKDEFVVNGGHGLNVVEAGGDLGFLGGDSDGEMMEIEVKEESIPLAASRADGRRRFTRSLLADSEMENGDLGDLRDAVILEADGLVSEELALLGSTKTRKMEMKMSKKILIKGRPTTVRELFETGLLEGYPVFYNGGKRVFRSPISFLSTTFAVVIRLYVLLLLLLLLSLLIIILDGPFSIAVSLVLVLLFRFIVFALLLFFLMSIIIFFLL